MTLTVLRLGIDTLEASIAGSLTAHAAEVLARHKQQAQEQERAEGVSLGGIDFALQPQGSKPFAYVLAANEGTIRLTPSEKLPGASVRLSSLGLALYEPLRLADHLTEIAGLFGPNGPQKASRIDVACDFQGLDLTDLGGARFVCRANFRPVYPNIERPETYQFGKGDLVVRAYNKTRELAVSGKTWLPALWSQHPDYDPGCDVWRFEVQLRRKVLRELRCDTPAEAIAAAPDLLRHGLSFADLRIPTSLSSDRWPRHPAWEALDAATGSHTTLTREALDSCDLSLSRIVPVIAGYTVSAGAALGILDFERAMEILASHMRKRLDELGGFEDAVRMRQVERLGKGA